MKKEKYPLGWNETRVRRVLEYYESQSDEDAAAEIEAGFESTTMEVPRALVPAVRQLIAKRKAARVKKTPNKLRIVAARGRKQRKSRRPTARRGKIRG